MTKVIAFGTFDIVHPGHVHMLTEAKQYGDYLVVVVARDQTVCEVKGRLPRNDETVRLKNIMDLDIADKVLLGCLDDHYKIIREVDPDIVALGYDQLAFVDNLSQAIRSDAKIVRLVPYQPEVFKSSKLS